MLAQSLTYSSGQPVSPAFEGWEEDKDGAHYFVFGYMNKNWEEELDVPIGAGQQFLAWRPDRAQPTHFLPRRNRFVFRVRVPQGFTEKDELVWMLTTHGRTTKAYASLRADYLVDDVVKASETGALGAGTSNPTVRANTPPTSRRRIEDAAREGRRACDAGCVIGDDGVPRARSREEFLAVLARRAASSPLGAFLGAGGGAGASGGAASGASPSAPTTEGERPSGAGAPAGGGLPPRWRRDSSPCRRAGSRSGRTWACTCRGSSTAARARCSLSRRKSKRGKTRGRAPTRRGRRSGLRRRCRQTARSRPTCGSTRRERTCLRTLADDGALTAAEDVTIVVTAANSTR